MASPSDDVKRRRLARAASVASLVARAIAAFGGHAVERPAHLAAAVFALVASVLTLRIARDAALALGLPVVSIATLFAFAVVSGSHPTHADLLLFLVLAIAAAATAFAGARLAAAHVTAASGKRLAWGAVALFGLGVGLLWAGEAVAVLVLNW